MQAGLLARQSTGATLVSYVSATGRFNQTSLPVDGASGLVVLFLYDTTRHPWAQPPAPLGRTVCASEAQRLSLPMALRAA